MSYYLSNNTMVHYPTNYLTRIAVQIRKPDDQWSMKPFLTQQDLNIYLCKTYSSPISSYFGFKYIYAATIESIARGCVLSI